MWLAFKQQICKCNKSTSWLTRYKTLKKWQLEKSLSSHSIQVKISFDILWKKKVSKSKIKIHWWTKINEPCRILQLSLLLWYTVLLTAVFCFIRSISTIRGTITTPSWWNAVRVVALKLIWTTEICWKSTQNKTFPGQQYYNSVSSSLLFYRHGSGTLNHNIISP